MAATPQLSGTKFPDSGLGVIKFENKDGGKVWDSKGIFEIHTQLESYSLFLAAKMSKTDHKCYPLRSKLAIFFNQNSRNHGTGKIQVVFFTTVWSCPKQTVDAPKYMLHL
jgi:hypothetical protein